MGRLSAKWRRLWGIRPGEMRRPFIVVGRGRRMGEPRQGPHGRGFRIRRRGEGR
jgi:hypothetical protein